MGTGATPSKYLYLLLRNRWFMVKALLLIMIPTIGITFALKKKYTVTTIVMPPETQTNYGPSLAGLGISEFAGYFSGGMGFSLPLMTTMSDVYEQILESRTLIEQVILSTGYIDEINLREKYEASEHIGLYWARKNFRTNYSVRVTPSGFLEMEVTTGDPDYSVFISERVVAVLDSINASIAVSRAQLSREYLELRSASVASILTETADAMQSFEEEHGIVAMDVELDAYIQNLAGLKRQYMELMAEASAIRSGMVGGSNATAMLKENEAAALSDIISMLETGITPPGYEEIMPPVPMDQLPEVMFQYAKLKADYEMSLELSSVVNLSLQQAIIEENRQQPNIRLLDPPMHPGWKSRPKRLYIWIEVFVLAFVGLFTYLLIRENYRRMRTEKPESWQKWQKLFAEIRGDFTGKGRKKNRAGPARK